MPESELHAVTSGVENALGATVENAHSFWQKLFGENALSKILAAAILLVVCVIFIRLLLRLTNRVLERSKIHTTMHSFIRTLVKMVLVFIAIMLIAGTLGIDTSSLLAIFSIAGLAISLSIQNALSNMTSAVMLLTSRPYQLGDFVEISGMQGTVREIGILCTKLATVDGKLISIPNSQAVSASITNFSAEENRRVMMSISAGYDNDVEKVKSALIRAADDPRVLPIEPVFARVSGYRDNAIEYALRFWVKNSDYWPVYFDVLERVKRIFDEEGISMTYPHLVVHSAK